jgi:UDP-glucose 4-epimerase
MRDGVDYLSADLTRHRSVRRLLFGPARDLGVKTIVHAALHRSVLGKRSALHAMNVASTRELLLLAEQQPTIERFVYRSFAEVYRVAHREPDLIDEEHPLELSPRTPQRVRDRVEADLTVCAHLGHSPLHIVVLRCAEIPIAEAGSQLYDYLGSEVCFRPLGFDPIINLLSVKDAARSVALAVTTDSQGVFNIPGADSLPLSMLIERTGRLGIPAPGPLLSPLYRLRRLAIGTEFRYSMNKRRFHFGGILDGRRAARALGYQPSHPIDFAALAADRLSAASKSSDAT